MGSSSIIENRTVDELDIVAGGLGCPDDGEDPYKSLKLTSGNKCRFIDDTKCPVCQFNHAKVSVRGA